MTLPLNRSLPLRHRPGPAQCARSKCASAAVLVRAARVACPRGFVLEPAGRAWVALRLDLVGDLTIITFRAGSVRSSLAPRVKAACLTHIAAVLKLACRARVALRLGFVGHFAVAAQDAETFTACRRIKIHGAALAQVLVSHTFWCICSGRTRLACRLIRVHRLTCLAFRALIYSEASHPS